MDQTKRDAQEVLLERMGRQLMEQILPSLAGVSVHVKISCYFILSKMVIICIATLCFIAAGEFSCTSNQYCLPVAWKCDGESDCTDGSDETDCGNNSCEAWQFQVHIVCA